MILTTIYQITSNYNFSLKREKKERDQTILNRTIITFYLVIKHEVNALIHLALTFLGTLNARARDPLQQKFIFVITVVLLMAGLKSGEADGEITIAEKLKKVPTKGSKS